MKNTIKLFAIALVAVIGFSFAACGGDDDTSNQGVAPTITTTTLTGGTVGTAYSETLTATGDTPITWSLENGTLPTGLNLLGSGTISGTPTTAVTSNFTVKATNAAGYNTKQLSITIAAGGSPSPSVSYIITRSGTTFTATKSGATVGTANQTITNVINTIQTDTNGANVAIQFGNGTDVLDIGEESAFFGGTWGIITITGKIISANRYTITLTSTASVSINSTADISNRNTAVSGGGSPSTTGIYNGGTGTVTINGGTVTALTAIQNTGTGSVIINSGMVSGIGEDGSGISNRGTVTINGGTVTATSASISTGAISNHGTVTISGGTVSAPNGCYAIWNNLGGTVTIGAGATINGPTHGI